MSDVLKICLMFFASYTINRTSFKAKQENHISTTSIMMKDHIASDEIRKQL